MTELRAIPWDSLGTLLAGRSPIDEPRLRLADAEGAAAFLAGYGFQWDRPEDRQSLGELRSLSLSFLERQLLADEPALSVPAEVREQEDLRHLLVWASGPEDDPRRRWSCALLRIMHTAAHATSSLERRFGRRVRDQIAARFRPHVDVRADGTWLGRGDEAVPLSRFEVRAAKDLDATLLKLLHKAENVAASVFDQVGVRLVVLERFDAVRVLAYLRAKHVVTFENVMPARTKNTLLDLAWARREATRAERAVRAGLITAAEALEALRAAACEQPYPPVKGSRANRFSSSDYHAIHLKCRERVLLSGSDGAMGSGGSPGPEEAWRFFFPFEVQLMDRPTHESMHGGSAAHGEYKERQRRAVKRRVLGSLLGEARG